MNTSVADLEELALGLSSADRGRLASRLIRSLSPPLDPDDEGVAEAERRDIEMDRDPSPGISLEELDVFVSKRRGQ